MYGHITLLASFLFILFRYLFFKDNYGSELYFFQLIPMLLAAIMANYVRHIVPERGSRVKAVFVFYIVTLINFIFNLFYLLVFEEVRNDIINVLIIVLGLVPLLGLLDAMIMFQQRRQVFISKQLVDNEALQKASINAPSEMEIYVLDNNFNYISFNDFHSFNMKRFFGTEPVIGHNFLSLIPNSHIRQRLESAISLAFNGKNYDVEFRQETIKGKYLHDFYAPLYDKNGIIIGATIFSYEITERKEREESITYLSYHDKLTGLYNRRFFDDYINDLTAYTDEVIVVYADINDLKVMNDLFGHDVGDELIILVASKLKEAFRNFGIVARTGGDEIVTIIKNAELVSVDSII